MSLANQVVESFNNAAGVTLSRGMIVRGTTGVRQTVLAQADTLAHLASIIGVANNGTGPTGLYFATVAGEVEVLLETGLTPTATQIVYVSASVAGRGTTAAPTLAIPMGVITDASSYSLSGRVMVSLFALFASNATPAPPWDPTLVRYWFIDNENGNDANVGYIDAAALTIFTPAQTSPVALRTSEEMRKRLPRFGQALSTVALYKPRSDNGNYLNKAGASDYLDTGYAGYAYIAFRASDLTNSVNDRSDMAGVTSSAGPNADGSWTATGMVGYTITNGAGVLPATDTVAGLKVEYQGNVTAGLRNIGNTVVDRTGATLLDTGVGTTLAALANGDQYYLRAPGVRFTRPVIPFGGLNGPNNYNGQFPVCGMRWTGTIGVSGSPVGVNFQPVFNRFDADTYLVSAPEFTAPLSYYLEDGATTVSTFCTIDARAIFNAYINGKSNLSMPAFHSTTDLLFGSSDFSIFNSGYSTLAPTVTNVRGSVGTNASNTIGAQFAVAANLFRPTRFIAGIALNGYAGFVLSIDHGGATNGIVFGRDCNFTIGSGGAQPQGTSGTSALAGVSSVGSTVVVVGTAAVGTTQDVLLAGSVVATFASLATSPQMDAQNNTVQGSAGAPVKKTVLKFSGVFVGAAGAKTDFLADSGPFAGAVLDAVVVNYPMPACRVRNLRIQASSNPLGANLVVRVLKNGAATGITATITTGSTALFSDLTNEGQFAAGDRLDIDMTETGAGTALLAASLECY